MRHRGLEGEAAPQLSGGVPLTAGRGGGLGARGPLGGDVTQFLLQIRKLSPRARKELFWTHSLGRRHRTEPPSRLPYSSPRLASRDWADIQALLDLLVEASGRGPVCTAPAFQSHKGAGEEGGEHEQGSSQMLTVLLLLWLLICLNRT